MLSSLRKATHALRSIRSLSFAAKVEDFSVKNEPIYEYLPGSKERKALEEALAEYQDKCVDVPVIIGTKEYFTKEVKYQPMPFDHKKKVAKTHLADDELIKEAINVGLEARPLWESLPLSERIKIFLKAGDLVSGKYRMALNAATMLGQGKTIVQAEIDAAAELADFLRFNAYFAKELTKYQPISTDPSKVKNSMRYRGIEGFFASISPFNFTAIGGNLASGPALMGNVVLWKPSESSILSNYIIFKVLQEAGFPPGVVNFLPSHGPVFGNAITSSPHLAGINFTGSLETFRLIWKLTSQKLDIYQNFPRLIGECGGKNFHFVHNSADVKSVAAASIRSAFEYSGQKCSALDRMYVPESIWPQIRDELLKIHQDVKLGSPLEYDSFLSAVIDNKAFRKIKGFIDYANSSVDMSIIAGGSYDDSLGYFIEPTIIETLDPHDELMQEEIFGPILVIYVYKDNEVEDALQLANGNQYALTGAVFAQDKKFLEHASEVLKMASGNFYLNDKSTGSVVGQQPFGGGRLSGTNDKAGGPHYMLRFASPQTVKETFVPVHEWQYPYMKEEYD